MNRRAFIAGAASLAVAPEPTIISLGSVTLPPCEAELLERRLLEHFSRFMGPPIVEVVRDYDLLKTGRIVIRINAPGGSIG